ncbi:MAG TPA: AmmeMemoRadiSam system protein B, partial [Dehalococcoidales bacterium]
MIREPAYAGQFYPGKPDELKAMIASFVNLNAEKEEVIGLVAPHAGYIYSGVVVGAVLSRVKFKPTFIILGPNHTGLGVPASIMTAGTWQTPLGDVEIDSKLAKKLLSISRYLKEDSEAHAKEHSIEVQLPFLQYFQPDVKFVPIILGVSDLEVFKGIGHEIARALLEMKKEAIIFASSDMNHYEPQPAGQKKDRQAIEAMVEMDADALMKRVVEQDISMCGYGPASVM